MFLAHQPGSEWLPGLDLYRVIVPDGSGGGAKGVHLWGPAPMESCRTFARLHAEAEASARRLNDWIAESGGFRQFIPRAEEA